jgi:hypothetical protein
MGTNCALLLADLFLYSNKPGCIEKLHEKTKSRVVPFNLTFWYIDDVSSINNGQFHLYVD